jgi:oligopeptide transport system ATP-binding protein
VSFATRAGSVRAVNGISFVVEEGETLGVVGESGCGKSVTALAIMKLLAMPPARITGGQVLFRGRDLLTLSRRRMRRIRGNEIAMIFQDPMTYLNPVMTVGHQIREVIELHTSMRGRRSRNRAVEMLEMVGIPSPERRAIEYPHQFSGGMRQRAMIAMALSCSPSLLIADEPTTAVDVTIQAQILELIHDLQRDLGMALMLITHDLGVVAGLADRIQVMYAGRIVEQADARAAFFEAAHPYTRGLLASIPRLDQPRPERLVPIDGTAPDLAFTIEGCAFAPRCPRVHDACREQPPLRDVGANHQAACWAAFADARPT